MRHAGIAPSSGTNRHPYASMSRVERSGTCSGPRQSWRPFVTQRETDQARKRQRIASLEPSAAAVPPVAEAPEPAAIVHTPDGVARRAMPSLPAITLEQVLWGL